MIIECKKCYCKYNPETVGRCPLCYIDDNNHKYPSGFRYEIKNQINLNRKKGSGNKVKTS